MLERGRHDPAFLSGRRGRALVRRAAARGARSATAGRRLHTGPVAQRAGLARSAAVPAAPHSRAAGGSRASWPPCWPQAAAGRRRADAVLHPPAARAAGARGPLLPERTPRRCAAITRARGGRRRGRRSCRSAPAPSPARGYAVDTSRSRPGSASRGSCQQHRRVVGSRLRVVASCTPARSAMVHLSRLAEDFVALHGEEFGFFELPTRPPPAAA
jgi:hypothetical protein